MNQLENGDNGSARVVIIGAGHAGSTFAGLLRDAGHKGSITLIGEEPVLPYHRPPLSKAYLKGAAGLSALKPESHYTDRVIDLRLGSRVNAIDTAGRSVLLADGTSENYDILILATGAKARRVDIPGAALNGVHYLRCAADADRLRASIAGNGRLVIVGGGYIGLEVAASALVLGCQVVLVEREDRILARVASAPLAEFLAKRHREAGLHIVEDAQVVAFDGQDGHVGAVRLADGTCFEADAVLVGVGASVCDELAVAAGLACADGILVDAAGCTSDPRIFAIGDVARFPGAANGGLIRMESVANAVEMAKRAVAAISGQTIPAHVLPTFWSEQGAYRLQIAGVADAGSSAIISRVESPSQIVIFRVGPDESVLSVEAVNAPREFMLGRMLIAEGRAVPSDLLPA